MRTIRWSTVIFMAVMGPVMAVSTGCTTLDEDPALLPPPSRICPSVVPTSYTPEQQAKKDEVDLFLTGRYEEEGWVILETAQTCSGDIWDWLDSASVPGSEVDPPPPPDIELPSGTELQLTELDLNPELQGPPNSVPMLRPSFAPYVFGDVEANSVQDFIDNEVTSVPGLPQASDRRYAGINKVVQNLGVQAYINAYNGKVEETIMSVMEIAVVCHMGSGLFAEEGFGKAAYFRGPRYRDLAGTLQWPDGAMAATPERPVMLHELRPGNRPESVV